MPEGVPSQRMLPLLLRLACLGCHIMPEMGRWTPSGLLNLLFLKSLGSLQEVLKWQELPQIGHRISIALQALSVSPLASTKVDLRMDS